MVEGSKVSGYTQQWRGGRAVECGGLENRYVGNPGVGGSNPPLSAIRAGRHTAFGGLSASQQGGRGLSLCSTRHRFCRRDASQSEAG